MAGKRRKTPKRRARSAGSRAAWLLLGIEVVAAALASGVVVVLVLGRATPWVTGRLLAFTAVVLALAVGWALFAASWLAARTRLAAYAPGLPAVVAAVVAIVALGVARRPEFASEAATLRSFVGARPQAHRETVAHQVYAAYRRADLREYARIIDRSRVYDATVRDAAAAFDLDPELLLGVASAESSFYPRDSQDGGKGLFQITSTPAAADTAARRLLGVTTLDPWNQRHNAFVAAATLRRYLDQMRGDPFLGLLAYNIGPKNGGLLSIMQQYGATDFATIQPYLQHLPRDYPIRVLTAALAFRVWRAEGRLPRYEERDNARRIQRLGIPGLHGHAS